jgi:hypothetical protein
MGRRTLTFILAALMLVQAPSGKERSKNQNSF